MNPLILGARAPSPAMSAERELSHSQRFSVSSVLPGRAGEGARAPSVKKFVSRPIDFWPKPTTAGGTCILRVGHGRDARATISL